MDGMENAGWLLRDSLHTRLDDQASCWGFRAGRPDGVSSVVMDQTSRIRVEQAVPNPIMFIRIRIRDRIESPGSMANASILLLDSHAVRITFSSF